jgi:putative NADPH-quinone reductase
LPPTLAQSREDMRWAEHVFLFPLWHGTMPPLLKGFLEQRPGFAMEYKQSGLPKRLLAGRSARIVVTMGMPVLLYRWYFGAYGVRSFERSMLSFAGISPYAKASMGSPFPTIRNVRAGSRICTRTDIGAIDLAERDERTKGGAKCPKGCGTGTN